MSAYSRKNVALAPRSDLERLVIGPGAIRGELGDHITRAAPLSPGSFDAAAMTVEATISTFADVVRRDTRGSYVERLDPAGLDTSRLVGAPVLDGHRQGSARDVIGVITSTALHNGVQMAIIRLSGADDAQPIITRIREGTLKGVSVGYRVTKWIDSTDPITKARVRTAAAWSIFEVSAVPIPADIGATFRNEPMPETIEIIAEPTIAENRAALRQIGRSANMTAEQVDDMIDRDLTIVEARAEAFEAVTTRTAPRIRVVSPSAEDPAIMRRSREEAVYARVSGTAPTEGARPFVGDTLRDHARALLESSGVSTRAMDADQLFRAAMHTTSDFPQLLQGVGNRTLMPAYQAAQSPLKLLARQATLADFRPGTRLKLSDVGLLEKVSEAGEIKSTTRGEAAESYALDTYATQFAISRKALINDDLGAFRDWGATAGRMAAETEANLLVSLLRQSNGTGPVMGEDNKRLFHADHGNLAAAGSALAITSLSDARLALRNLKALDRKTPINATPKYLVVGPELETAAEQVLAQIHAATVGDVNPFGGKLTLLVEPRITDDSWYVFADPAVLPVLEYAYLASAQGPQMASREGWDVLGMEFRVVLDFGAGAIDWRGAYRNPGL